MAYDPAANFESTYGMSAAEASAMYDSSSSPALGFEESLVTEETTFSGKEKDFSGLPVTLEYTEQIPITAEDVRSAIGGLEEQERKAIAYEMFLGVPVAYSSYEDVFNEDGSINETYFVQAVERTLNFAEKAAPSENYYFLDILQRSDVNEMTPAELTKAFQDRVAEIEEEKRPKRVINYMDPAGLQAALNDASASVLGRKMTNQEMKSFVSKIHGMQASGISSISVGAQAREFARFAAPVEAGAMDYSNAAALIMQAAGIGGRR